MKLFERWFSKTDPSRTGDEHARRGVGAAKSGNYAAAVPELELAIEQGVSQHDLAELYTILGRSYQELRQFDKSIAAHKKSIEIAPNYHKAWNNLGITHFEHGNLAQAEQCHQRAVRLAPDYAFAHASLGAVCIHRNNPRQAIQHLQKAIHLNPQIAVAHSNLALAYAMLDHFAEAEAALKQAIVLGYKDWQNLQKRIQNLKAVAGTGQTTGSQLVQNKVTLPSRCPGCGAPVSAASVRWTGSTLADCPYCGVNLTHTEG